MTNAASLISNAASALFEVDEFHDHELHRLTILCRRLRALSPFSSGTTTPFPAGSAAEDTYNRRVLVPFLNAHFNGVTSTPRIFTRQLLKILLLLKTDNITNVNLSMLPMHELYKCCSQFDDDLFVALYTDWEIAGKKEREILSDPRLGTHAGKLKKLEVEQGICKRAANKNAADKITKDFANKRADSEKKFAIAQQMIGSLVSRELGVGVNLAETKDIDEWEKARDCEAWKGVFATMLK